MSRKFKRAIAGPDALSPEERATWLDVIVWWEHQLRPDRRFLGSDRTNVGHTTIGWLALHVDDDRGARGLFPLPASVVIPLDQREIDIRLRRALAYFWWTYDLFCESIRDRQVVFAFHEARFRQAA